MRRLRRLGGDRGTRIPAAGVALAVVFAARAAPADEIEPIRVTVTAPAGCPDADAFTAEVIARTAKARIAAPGEAARSFTVTITRQGRRVRGRLSIADPRGAGGTREMAGESCEDVASALALVTALAVDPNASTAARPPPPPAPKAAPPRPRPFTMPPLPRPRPYAPLPWWGPIGAPLPALPTATRAHGWRAAAVIHAGAASAIGPSTTLVLSGAVDVAKEGEGMLAPAFRLGLISAAGAEQAVSGAPLLRARYRLTAASVEGCPVRLPLAGPLALYPCLHVEAGAIGASGLSPYTPAGQLPKAVRLDTTRPWIAPGITGRLQLAVAGGLILEAQGGLILPLFRDTFYFGQPPSTAGEITSHQVPAAGGFVSGGVGFHFP